MIRLLVHAVDGRTAQQEARRQGVRLSEMVWCQRPENMRGLSLSHLTRMREVHPTDCGSELCDETKARLRVLGWTQQ